MLGGIKTGSMTQSLKQHYADTPALKNFISFDAGIQTAYSHVDIVTESAGMQPYDWTSSKIGEATTVIDNDVVGHNKNLIGGAWGQAGLKESMWIVCGTLTSGTDDGSSEGASIFGFGDSTPNTTEVVMGLQGNRPYAIFKGATSAGTPSGNNTQIPTSLGGFSAVTSPTETSLICFIHRPNGGALGDATVELVLVTPNATTTESLDENPSGSGLANFPPTYSLGQSWVETGGFPAFSGAWKGLSVISSFNFSGGIPSNYIQALEEMRTAWAAGRKVLPASLRGLT